MKKKIFATSAFILVGLVVMIIWQEVRFADGKVHIVFCDVGQGDAIFIRTPQRSDILIDGGPDRKVLDCLSSHMPFWDRTLEVAIVSHPHQDHFAGFIDIVRSYNIVLFATEKLRNDSTAFQTFVGELAQNHIDSRYLLSGSRLKIGDGVELTVLAPTKEFLKRTSPKGSIGENGEFASLVLLLSYGEFRVLFTGDAQAGQVREGVEGLGALEGGITVLQVPHHGSKTGLNRQLVEGLFPKLAVISVGKNNRYHHPHEETIKILSEKDIKILRTDMDGEIEIVTDGKTWAIR